MSTRTRGDKKIRKQMRAFFKTRGGQELSDLTRQNGMLKIALIVLAFISLAEVAIIIMVVLK